ncbi:hypothetical protein QRD89_11240 [Halobacillus sp. ACCC02827]|uniref:hypothetical protein n=1 Tax=Bacillaceae TaxID=186817 RepID=UPI0002A4F57C|nr:MULTISPECIES: hypothetical protein [Bacillaceae]ELK44895.1 hypothetical protein D479_17039 [Halobacillus sp. BAB-2008]QHT47073.1 hypothetical protein M662_11410 [Bacillus sp. SB49]WJE14300.1 hypothetical protein QRD89_11240 [Halobacillus sp. ACCC02827]
MGVVHWYDWIIPTSPFASFLFGMLFTAATAGLAWWETRSKRVMLLVFSVGAVVTCVGVLLLKWIGHYG